MAITIHSGTSAYSTSGWNDHRAAEESWACIAFVEGVSFFRKGEVTEVSGRLNVIRRFANVRPSLNNLYSAYSWFMLAMSTVWRHTRIFRLGSAAAKRPAVMHAEAPPGRGDHVIEIPISSSRYEWN